MKNHIIQIAAANMNDALVVGTGDLSELALGQCTYTCNICGGSYTEEIEASAMSTIDSWQKMQPVLQTGHLSTKMVQNTWYTTHNTNKILIDEAFDSYVKKGGMAGSYLYKTEEDARQYVNGIYRTTITKDIVRKFKIENEDLLIMIGNYLMDNVGNQTSIRNVASKLTSGTYKTNDKTVGAYINYLCRSFLFYPIQRYDIKGKRYLESDKKYYLSDLAFRFSEIGTKNADYGHLYENIVAIELLRRGYEVYVGKLYEKEVDFVAIKEGEKVYIQVSDDIYIQRGYF